MELTQLKVEIGNNDGAFHLIVNDVVSLVMPVNQAVSFGELIIQRAKETQEENNRAKQ